MIETQKEPKKKTTTTTTAKIQFKKFYKEAAIKKSKGRKTIQSFLKPAS